MTSRKAATELHRVDETRHGDAVCDRLGPDYALSAFHLTIDVNRGGAILGTAACPATELRKQPEDPAGLAHRTDGPRVNASW